MIYVRAKRQFREIAFGRSRFSLYLCSSNVVQEIRWHPLLEIGMLGEVSSYLDFGVPLAGGMLFDEIG